MTGRPARTSPDGEEQDRHAPALLIFGVDGLSVFEELLGPERTEEIANQVESRLVRALARTTPVRRLDIGRFAVELKGAEAPEILALVERGQAAAALAPVQTASGPLGVTVSAGAVPAGREPRASERELRARQALAQASRDGAGGFRFCEDPEAARSAQDELLGAARAALGALDGGQLVLAYQPVVRSDKTSITAFHECLARVVYADGTIKPAAAFIPAMERLGLATILDRHTLLLALDMLARHPGHRLSINIFPVTMQDAQWLSIFENAVRAQPTLGERLIVELAETGSMLDFDRTRRFLDRMRDHGVALAIDDFGSGHTSIAHLRDFRFDILKIDGKLVRNVDTNPDHAFLIGKLVEIADRFDMLSVAEFVETEEEVEILSNLGVSAFQGYHFGKPSLVLDPDDEVTPMVAVR